MTALHAPTDKSILDILRAANGPVAWPRLMVALVTSLEEERALKKLLKKLAASGRIVKLKSKRYMLPPEASAPDAAQTPLAEASAESVRDHVVVPRPAGKAGKRKAGPDGGEDSANDADASRRATGTAPAKGGPDAKGTEGVMARVAREGKFLFAITGEGRSRLKYVLPRGEEGAAKPGSTVRIKPLGRKGPFGYPAAKVLATARVETDFADVSRAFFKRHGIPAGYPKAATAEAMAQPEPVFDQQAARLDLRGEHIVTIDPPEAKDHDDALSLEKLPDGRWKLGVHIADVSEYVRLDGHLDEEALRRAYTQYLPWTAAPMLPQRLSGDLCSLLEGRDRLALSCFMEVGADGTLESYRFEETFIRVTRFYSYQEAQGLKDQGEPFLCLLSEFTDALLAKRKRDGHLDFQLPEPRVMLDEARAPMDIYPGVRLPAHGWVEECMLLANQAAARHLHKHKLPGLFRVHEQPDIEVVQELWNNQAALATHTVTPSDGADTPPEGATRARAPGEAKARHEAPATRGKGGKDARDAKSPGRGAKDAAKGHGLRDAGSADMFTKMRETGGYLNPVVQKFYVRLLDPSRGALPPSVQRKILQSMKKAQYSASPLGHFALGWQYYAHFTSPIRRYADLWTHRVMKMHARGKKIPRVLRDRAIAVADEISGREIDVVKTERKAMRVATAWIFRKLIGREFEGEISGVESFGMFVTVTAPYGEGMVPVARMRGDYFEKDLETGHLVGARTGLRFQLGQKIRVRVAKSDPMMGYVDFDLLGPA